MRARIFDLDADDVAELEFGVGFRRLNPIGCCHTNSRPVERDSLTHHTAGPPAFGSHARIDIVARSVDVDLPLFPRRNQEAPAISHDRRKALWFPSDLP